MTEQVTDPPVEAPGETRGPADGEVHRYPGSPPFGDTDIDRLLFRGRGKEVDEVLHSILSYDLFLIYAASGMGKTSMLTTGVLESLRQRDYFPVIVRLNTPGTSPVEVVDAQIRETGARSGVDVTRSPIAATPQPVTLWDLFSGLEIWRGNTLQHLVVVFDQFEELFTLGWSDDERTRFIAEFGEVVRRHRLTPADERDDENPLPAPRVKFILLMREDFLGQLEGLAVHVPQIMHRRFRLEGLHLEQAEAAVREPAALVDPRLCTPPFTYRQEAVDAILTFLRTKNERGKEVQTSTIDPSQLQIICQHVERAIVPAKGTPLDGVIEITADDLGGKDGLERIVGDFYRRVVESFPHRQRMALRELCEQGLISQSGRRLSVEEGEICSEFDVTKELLHALVDQRLLRSEPRVGSVYYELSHDSLTGPILAYRDERNRARGRRRMRILLVAAGLIGVVLLAVVVARSIGDGSSAAPTEQLDIGQTLERSFDAANDAAVFEFTTTNDDLVVVEVHPAPTLAVTLEVASSDADEAAASISRMEPNSEAAGSNAVAVVGGQEGRYQATVRGASAGAFEIAVRPIAARSIEVPGTASVELEAGGLAVFELDMTDNRPFVVTATPDPQLDVALAVIDPGGVTNERNRAAKSSAESAVDGGAAGRYWIVVGSFEMTRGTFDLSVESAVVDPLGVDEAKSGQSAGPFTLYEIDLQNGQPFIVTMSSANESVYLELIEPDGSHATTHSDDSGDRQYVVASGAPGAYLAVIDGPQSSTFDISATSVDVAEMRVGETAAGELANEGAIAVFAFDAVEDDSLVVDVAPTSGNLNPVLTVSGSDDFTLWSDNYGSGKLETAWIDDATAGRYLAMVTASADGPAGAFTVSVRRTEAVELAVGDTVSGAVNQNGQLTIFEFEAPDPGPLEVEVASRSGLDAVLEVRDPSGVVSTADSGAVGDAEAIIVEGGLDGRYRVLITRFEETSGDFELSVQRAELQTVGLGESAGASLAPGEIAAFEVDAPAGELTTVTVEPEPGLRADLEITGPDDAPVPTRFTDAAGREVVLIPDTAAGIYRAVVRAFYSSGRFTLAVQPGEVVELEPDVERTGTLSADQQFVAFEFDVPDDGSYLVQVTPDAHLDAAAQVTATSTPTSYADSHLSGGKETVLTSGSAGRHLAVVSAVAGEGPFSIALQPFEAAQVPVLEDEPFAILEPGDVSVAEFDVDVEGRPLAVSVAGRDGLIPTLEVFSADGSPIGSTVQSGNITSAVVRPHETGRHRAVVSGENGSVGQFELTVHSMNITTLVPGDAAEGVIRAPGDVTGFQLENQSGRPLVIDVVPDQTVDPVVHVTDPAGRSAAIDAGAVGEAETLEVAGAGPFEVTVMAPSAGRFQIAARDLDADGVLQPGSPTQGLIGRPGDVHVYEFVTTDDRARVVTLDTDEDVAATLNVIDPSEDLWEQRSEGGTATLEVDGETGRHLVVISGWPPPNVGYHVSVSE